MEQLKKCMQCIKETDEVINEIITECDEGINEVKQIIEELNLKSSVAPNESDLGLVRREPDPAVNGDPEECLYWAVLSFPVNMKFKLKVKNKTKCARLQDFTFQQQTVLFKRRIEEWQGIASSGDIIIVPEYNKKDPVYHYNIIFRAFTSQKPHDMRIAFVEAYGVPYQHKNIFCYIQKLAENEPDTFLEGYLKKETGKGYQYTGIRWTVKITCDPLLDTHANK